MTPNSRMPMVCLTLFALLLGCGGGEETPAPTAEAPVGVAEPAADTPTEEVAQPPLSEPYEGEDAAFLTVNSKPWSVVYLDAERVRNTPLKDRKIAPGAHTLVLRCGSCDPAQEKTLRFNVSAGETYTSVRNEFAQAGP